MKIFLFICFTISALAESFLTTKDIELFYEQGFILKKQCLSSKEIEQLNFMASEIIERAFQKKAQSPYADTHYIDGSRIFFGSPSSIARINGVSGMQPLLLNTLRSEKMARTFFALLGTDHLEHLICQLHPKLPGDGIAFPRHRDIQFRRAFDPEWQDVLGNGSYAVCVIPLDPMNRDNGGLWVDRNNYPEDEGLDENRFWIEAEPGDLLFMHSHLFHGSGPNLSSAMSRKTLLTGFCAFGANHKPYPGADVNTRLTLLNDGSIAVTPLFWDHFSGSSSDPSH